MDWSISEIVSTITLVAIVSVLIGDRALGWLKTKGIDLSKLEEMYELTYNTHVATTELLRQFDEGKLEETMKSLADNIAAQTEVLQGLLLQSQLQHEEHKLMMAQLGRIADR